LWRQVAGFAFAIGGIFDQWWRSWFGGALPAVTPEDHATMPGMLRPDEAADLREADGAAFDVLFRGGMSFHHTGSIAMADEALRQAGDPRLRIMAHAIRHGQRGEIELMRGIKPGLAVARAATSALLAPVSEGSAEHRVPAHRH
jgi:uncharacterized protein (DUF305 family)